MEADSPPFTPLSEGVLAIVQARMHSSRLPGKSLRDLCGHPLLWWTIERLRLSIRISSIVIATSTHTADDAIEQFGEKHEVEVVRGPHHDVAERFRQVLTTTGVDAFARISGDSPLIDPKVVDHVIDVFVESDCDVATNVFPRTFPRGQSVEVVRAASFLRLLPAISDDEREHVTLGFYRRAGEFRIENLESDAAASAPSLAVDTAADFDRVAAIIAGSGDRPGGWRDLVGLAEEIRG